MNKKDCENIAYILVENNVPRHIAEAFFKLDERIKTEFEDFNAVFERDEAVLDRHNELMTAELGENWATRKASKERNAELYDQARHEVYGEDYYPLRKRKDKDNS